MQRVDEEFIFVLAGSCFCTFLFVVILGGTFLFLRIRQQERSGIPAPEPPVMTRDVHATPPRELPTRPPRPPESESLEADSVGNEPIEVDPLEPPGNRPEPQSEIPTLRPGRELPVGMELDDADDSTISHLLTPDEDAETRLLTPEPDQPSKRRPPPLTPITLSHLDDEESPTVVVDRSKPFDPEDDQ